jgi:hypothetical protein
VDDYLATVLHMAVKYGVADTVRELIEHGADKDRSVTGPTGTGQLRGRQGHDKLEADRTCSHGAGRT